MTNKEAIEKLTEYFLTQDPRDVAELCASKIIDINKLVNIDKLTFAQQEHLIFRIDANWKEECDFLETGKVLKLKLIDDDMPSE